MKMRWRINCMDMLSFFELLSYILTSVNLTKISLIWQWYIYESIPDKSGISSSSFFLN